MRRQEILRLLGRETQKSTIVFGKPPTLSLFKSYSFEASPMQDLLALHGRIDEFLITYGWKRVARLERGGSMLSVGAMSRLQQCSVQSLTVDGQQWTDDIFTPRDWWTIF